MKSSNQFPSIFNENETICYFPHHQPVIRSQSANKWEKNSNMTHKILTLFASISEVKRHESAEREKKFRRIAGAM
jgi:hypothetical protein